jgi:UDP-N-acetylglucosamine 4-epimerase
MSTPYETIQEQLRQQPTRWLVTGVAGFIGSNLLEHLLRLGQDVVGLDNFSTGLQHNLDDVRTCVGEVRWRNFHFIEGDITRMSDCKQACDGATYVLHQAALGSVPRSIDDPLATHAGNVTGFANMLVAARDANVQRFVYASSSSVYGDHPGLPKVEDQLGEVLSPYAASKLANEVYAKVFSRVYDIPTVGLRYFNVFGSRQDPHGAYAAVIPRWFNSLLQGESCLIFGDGETSRDFTHVSNVVQANLLAATVGDDVAGQVLNVACGGRLTLRQLHNAIATVLLRRGAVSTLPLPNWLPFRPGDIRHSLADITKARQLLGYEPDCTLDEGLEESADWYLDHYNNIARRNAAA